MKVIKPGIIPEYKFTCNICGCEFIAYRTECEIYYGYNPTWTRQAEYAVAHCPICNSEVSCCIEEEQKSD